MRRRGEDEAFLVAIFSAFTVYCLTPPPNWPFATLWGLLAVWNILALMLNMTGR